MSLLSIPVGPVTDGLSYSGNLFFNNGTANTTNSNNSHNHYHQTNQYIQQHAQNQHDPTSQLIPTIFSGGFNRTSKQSQLLPAVIPSSYSLLSFLYSDTRDISSTTSSPSDSIYSDYNEGGNNADDSVQDAFVEGSNLWSLLVVGYSLVFIIGVIGNTALLAALCGTGSRARALPVRNHLMINLAAADLLVTAICVPISACAAASHACWPSFFVSTMCQLAPLLQRTPVTASTLSLALLSLDRFLAIRHPRLAQRFRERRFVTMSMAVTWILASLVAAPNFWVRQWDEGDPLSYLKSAELKETQSEEEVPGNYSSGYQEWERQGVCTERWTNVGVHLAYAATYLGTAFVAPALIVGACHASVSHKLTTQLKVLSGQATSGDRFISSSRPRPKQVLIVARDPSNNIIPDPLNPPILNNPGGLGHARSGSNSRSGSIDCPARGRKFVPCDPDDEDDIFVRMQIEADLESLRQISEYQKNLAKSSTGSRRGVKSLSTFRSEPSVSNTNNNNTLKAAKRETSIIRAHRRLRKLNVPKGLPISTKLQQVTMPMLPTYSSQSFRSRRRAANLLAALAAVFVIFWAPYVVVSILEMFLKDKELVRLIIPFSLFLGHAHSAINPIVSWRLNRSAFVRFQRESLTSFLPSCSWLRSINICRLFCYSCSPSTCCDKSEENPTLSPGQSAQRSRPPLRRAGTRYPGVNENHNPFLNAPLRRHQRGNNMNGNESSKSQCCNCICSGGIFGRRRSSSPDLSTNDAALGAFNPKFIRVPLNADPISKCHTSHFLR